MKAILPTKPVLNGKNYSVDKELHQAFSVVVSTKDGLSDVVTARVYYSRARSASVAYVSIWATGRGIHCAGHGTAGGYGYHRNSAALAHAITSAGIRLDSDISGAGTGAMRDALTAIARAMGFKSRLLVVEH